MANLIRHATSGNHWTSTELDAYNIRILTVDTEEFFGVSHLPPPTVDPIILNNVEAPVGSHLSREIHLFFRFLRNILDPPIHNKDTATQEDTSHALDLSFHTLRFLLHFSKPDRLILRCNILRFTVSRKQVRAKLDITLLDSENRILLILEEKNTFPRDQPEPRLVAKAVAAFQTDCDGTATGLPPVLSKRYIGIVMNRSTPHFYKITITQALVDAVMHGLFPAEETVVERFIPPVPDVWGMLSLEDRRICFQCFEALKTLL